MNAPDPTFDLLIRILCATNDSDDQCVLSARAALEWWGISNPSPALVSEARPELARGRCIAANNGLDRAAQERAGVEALAQWLTAQGLERRGARWSGAPVGSVADHAAAVLTGSVIDPDSLPPAERAALLERVCLLGNNAAVVALFSALRAPVAPAQVERAQMAAAQGWDRAGPLTARGDVLLEAVVGELRRCGWRPAKEGDRTE